MVDAAEAVSIGFDGSLNDDSTVLRGCRMSDGYRFTIGMWEKPLGPAGIGWEVPRSEVLAKFRWALGHFTVSRAYCDPHEWRSDIDALALEFNPPDDAQKAIVIPWATSRDVAMGAALDRLATGLKVGETFHEEDSRARDHYGNAYLANRGKLRLVRKEYPNSPRKIDTVPTDALAYEARADAIAAGWSDAAAEPTYFRLPR